jgi:hypothetical protein
VIGSTAALLLNVRAETQSLFTTARIGAFVAAILKLRLLRMISALRKFTADKLGFTNRAL